MAEPYYLKLMGFPELRRPDGQPVRLKVRKHLALLIYLVIDAKAMHSRDELVELLWPDVPIANGRHSLSMAFSVLRSLFGSACIRGNHSEVGFVSPGLQLDLDRLQSYQILGGEVAEPLEIDGFLQGFEIEDAPGFQHWRDRRNARLLPMIRSGLLLLTDEARRSGDLVRLQNLADRLLGLDPLAEEGVRARMEVFALEGDRLSALRLYENWKRQLHEELGAAPSEILEAMAARLRRSCAAQAVRNARPDGLPLHTKRCFVGRIEEYRLLFEAWEATSQLNTRHVVLSGETGIGKSSLALRFAESAALEGAAVARVQCFELEQRIAFGMIGALVTRLLDLPAVRGTAPESLAEVARIVPAVRERFPHLPPPCRSEGEAARLQFAEGTFAVFEAILEEQPLVLIIDDYPRSDEASLSILHMLLRRAENERLMVVLSGRLPEPEEPVQATRIRMGVSYLPLQRIDLGPLTGEEGEAMLEALLSRANRQPGTPQRQAILQTAGGNPMALELLTQDWIAHGDDALAVSLPAMRSDVPGSAFEAVGYDRLIERMLPGLSPRTRLVLFLAAILGPRLNEMSCFDAVGISPVQTIAALGELVERRVLRNTEKGLEFVNELVRARLYLKIPTAARVKLHDRVATRLLTAISAGETIPGLEVAWHCIRAKRREEATPYLMKGARTAITQGAPDEAARALSSALGHMRGRPKAEATLLLAETYQEMADWSGALECLQDLEDEHRADPYMREMSEVLEMESRYQLDTYPVEKMPSIVGEFLSKAIEYREPAARVRAAASAACLAGTLRIQDLLSQVSHSLSQFPIEFLSEHDTSRVLLARAIAHYHARDNNGLKETIMAADLLEAAGAADTTFVRIHTGLGVMAAAEGKYGEAVPSLARAFKVATRLDNLPLMSLAAANLGLCHYRLGQLQDHLHWGRTAWDQSTRLTSGSYVRVHSAALCAFAEIASGSLGRARKSLAFLRQEKSETQLSWIRQAAVLYEADISWLLGDKRNALRLVMELEASMNDVPSIGFVGRFARWRTLVALRTGSANHVRRFLKEWHGSIGRLDAFDRAEVLCSLAELEAHMGRDPAKILSEARVALAALPVACAKQMQQFGLHLPH